MNSYSQLHFELYQDAQGQHRWRLRHANGQVMADCAEGYASRYDCVHGIRAIQQQCLMADVREEKEEAAESPAVVGGT
jgi:uncharacterized protein